MGVLVQNLIKHIHYVIFFSLSIKPLALSEINEDSHNECQIWELPILFFQNLRVEELLQESGIAVEVSSEPRNVVLVRQAVLIEELEEIELILLAKCSKNSLFEHIGTSHHVLPFAVLRIPAMFGLHDIV